MLTDSEFTLKEIFHPKSGTAVIAKLGEGLKNNLLEIPVKKDELSIMEVF
jgi:hypothetical protein